MRETPKYHLPANYQIRISASLNPDWAFWFEDFLIEEEEDGTCSLIGRIEDQAALYGLITKISNLGLIIISLEQTER